MDCRRSEPADNDSPASNWSCGLDTYNMAPSALTVGQTHRENIAEWKCRTEIPRITGDGTSRSAGTEIPRVAPQEEAISSQTGSKSDGGPLRRPDTDSVAASAPGGPESQLGGPTGKTIRRTFESTLCAPAAVSRGDRSTDSGGPPGSSPPTGKRNPPEVKTISAGVNADAAKASAIPTYVPRYLTSREHTVVIEAREDHPLSLQSDKAAETGQNHSGAAAQRDNVDTKGARPMIGKINHKINSMKRIAGPTADAWHLPCGPVVTASVWASTKNNDAAQTTYLVDRGIV